VAKPFAERLARAHDLIRKAATKDALTIYEGVGWLSDGHLLVADSIALGALTASREPTASVIRRHLAMTKRHRTVDASVLRQFAVRATSRIPGGSPNANAGLWRGVIPVRIGPALINPRLLYFALAASLPSEDITIEVANDWEAPVIIYGEKGGWTALIMSLRPDPPFPLITEGFPNDSFVTIKRVRKAKLIAEVA
jgi:hypothetical protein